MAAPSLHRLLLRRTESSRYLQASAGAHRDMSASSLARAARPPPCAARCPPSVRPTGGRRYDVSWALGRGPGAVQLLLPQVLEEQHYQARRTPFLCSKPPGAAGMQAIRPLATGAVALLHCRHRWPGTRFYPRLPQVIDD